MHYTLSEIRRGIDDIRFGDELSEFLADWLDANIDDIQEYINSLDEEEDDDE